MTDRQDGMLNNLYFYGVSFSRYDTLDVTDDIITNIRRRFLLTSKPASNKLYRFADGQSFVYSYSFSSQRPLQWKVTKNRRTIEEIEYLLSGKYCINYYDDYGKDVKKVFLDPKHRWLKTNYYNQASNESLSCTLVPKEFDEGTSIMLYATGVVYPERLFSCTVASCAEVNRRVLSKVSAPTVTALTDKGIVYFMPENEKKLYEALLSEEEQAFCLQNRPEVFVSAEDAASGFNLRAEDFDMSKNLNRTFDISLAEDFAESNEIASKPCESIGKSEDDISHEEKPASTVDDAISGIVEKINSLTALGINAGEIIGESDTSDFVPISSLDADSTYETEVDGKLKHIDSVLDGSSEFCSRQKLCIGDAVVDDDYISAIIDGIIFSAFGSESTSTLPSKTETDFTDSPINSADSVINEAKVQTDEALLSDLSETTEDSITQTPTRENAASQPASVEKPDTPNEEDIDSSPLTVAPLITAANENDADAVLESRGESYYYFGDVDKQGNRSGRGRTLMSDGSIAYEGEYLDDKRCGKGSFYFKDGSLCYWGDWQENLRCGFGVGVSSEDGSVHIGKWQNNKPMGVGVRFDKEGNLMFASSSCEQKKTGFTLTGFSDTSFTVRVWSEKDDAFIQREIFLKDIVK